jgi:metal-responsive CopG/Arc/MetJ family transcriptional regulator
MPRPTKPLDDLDDAASIRVQVRLDPATLRTLDEFVTAHPDIQSRSAAIRKLTRDWRRKAKL